MFQREYGSNNSEPSFASFAVAVCLISPFTLFEKAFFDFQTGSVTDAHYQILQPSLKWKLTPLAFYFSLPRFCFRCFRLQCFIMSKRFFFCWPSVNLLFITWFYGETKLKYYRTHEGDPFPSSGSPSRIKE